MNYPTTAPVLCPTCKSTRLHECGRVECGRRFLLTASPPGGARHQDGTTPARINERNE